MKVELKIAPEYEETSVVIYAREVTEDIQRIISLLDHHQSVLTAADEERTVVLRPEEVYMVRVEQEKVVIYTKADHYISNKRLYELEQLLGGKFMRVSKSTIVNLCQIASVEPSFGGNLLLKLRNGRAVQGMIQMGIGCTILLLVSYVEGWIPTLKAILPMLGIAVLVWLGFTLYYRWEANLINRKLRESSAKE